MSHESASDSRFAELRKQAEELIAGRPSDGDPPTGDVLELIHELRVYQTELELQNENLLLAQIEIEELKMEFEHLYQEAPCGYVTLSPELLVTRANRTAPRLLATGDRSLVGRRLEDHLMAGGVAEFRDALSQAGQRGDVITKELPAGDETFSRWLRFDIVGDRSTNGSVAQWRVTITDVSERHDAEDKTRRAHVQLRGLASRLQIDHEKALAGVERDLHDSLSQQLVAMKMEVETLAKLREERAEAEDSILRLSKLADSAIGTARKLTMDLRPGMLRELGLVQAVREMASTCERSTKMSVTVTAIPDEIPLGEVPATALYRVLEELLGNIVRHADSGRAGIAMRVEDEKLTIEVTDNGKGISEAELDDPGSVGIAGIRERIHSLGGEVEFTGAAKAGTTVRIAIPVVPPG